MFIQQHRGLCERGMHRHPPLTCLLHASYMPLTRASDTPLPRLLHASYTLTRLLHASYKPLTRLLHASYKPLTRLLHASYTLTPLLQASYTLLHASYTPLTLLLHASYTLYTPLTRLLHRNGLPSSSGAPPLRAIGTKVRILTQPHLLVQKYKF
jgi:hypothetical protein